MKISKKALVNVKNVQAETKNIRTTSPKELKSLYSNFTLQKLSTDTYSNPILRGLCLSELMAITDVNSDYKLEFDEFHKCLHPSFYPPKEGITIYNLYLSKTLEPA